MRSGLRAARAALVLLGLGGCTQEVSLPVVMAPAEGEPDAGKAPRRKDAALAPGSDAEDPVDADEPAPTDPPDGGPDGSGRPDPDCRPLPGPLVQLNPQVVIALDRSASMFRKPAGGGQPTIEWVRSGLRGLLGTYEGIIHIGYEEFPIPAEAPECGGGICCASDVLVAPMASPLSAMEARWSCGHDQPTWCAKTSSESPSYEALGRIRAKYRRDDDGSDVARYALLLVDHDPWCEGMTAKGACQATIDRVWSMRTTDPVIKTMVYGMSTTVADSLCLSEMAHRGGMAREAGAFPSHFVALDETSFVKQLGDQLANVARGACAFAVPYFPSSHLLVTLDGDPIPRDEGNGWSWVTSRQIRFNGSSCDRLLGATATAVSVQQCRR
jgi:hypothetical protein